MTLRVPLLTEVYLRAWGTDDPRVLSPLRAENQPALTFRARAVEGRAIDAGYPVLDLDGRRMAATAAVRRLEPMDYTPQGQRDRHRQRVAAAAYESRRSVTAQVDDDLADAGPVTMFDE
jgi:hypothetical protein